MLYPFFLSYHPSVFYEHVFATLTLPDTLTTIAYSVRTFELESLYLTAQEITTLDHLLTSDLGLVD